MLKVKLEYKTTVAIGGILLSAILATGVLTNYGPNAYTLFFCLSMLTVFALSSKFLFSEIVSPLLTLNILLRRVAAGETDINFERYKRAGEIGRIAQDIEALSEKNRLCAELQAEAERDHHNEVFNQKVVEKLIAKFQSGVNRVIENVASQSVKMTDSAATLKHVASTAMRETSSAKIASAEASGNVQTVASAAEQLASSIHEISSQAENADKSVHIAAELTHRTNREMSGLTDAAEKIGAVVFQISEIAERTNLLALNATIEAARAGGAGAGFAVVAAEVKGLSHQTAKATDDITEQIANIQASVKSAVNAIASITSSIAGVEEVTTAISAAVIEQDSATQEIARSITLASDGSAVATKNVNAAAQIMDETSRVSDHINDASHYLTDTTEQLSRLVEEFLRDVKKENADRRAKFRQKLRETVTILIDDAEYTTILTDKSEGGMCIHAVGNLQISKRVEIELKDGARIPALVAWHNEHSAGLQLLKTNAA